MSTKQITSLLVLIISCCLFNAVQSSKPNIVFVLVDDWGYSDVGFRNPAVLTPTFDKLAKDGLILDRHYVFKYCSPSRASFLTGRWPHHTHQYNIEPPFMIGANINITMLPAKLKQAGYKTHIVGKWHEGYFQRKFLPINRGFDTSSGFLSGAASHMTDVRECAVDFWKNDAYDTRNGTYDAYIYRDDLKTIFDNHSTTDPLFLYLPLHNVHGPFQAPDEWLNKYDVKSTCSFRRTYQAMVSVADNVTGVVVEMLKKKGMWDNTIMVVSADNGGAECAGSNHPLKGAKGTFYEGGVRANAFAGGGLIPKEMVGKKVEGFIHIADWYPTFCKLAGVDPSDSGTGKFPVDGMDVWPLITGQIKDTGDKEIVLGYNFTYGKNRTDQGAIIVGKHKLIIGPQGGHCDGAMWSPIDYPCTQGDNDKDCDPYCVFDIVDDPEERHNLVKEQPDLLKTLLASYNKYSKEPREMQDQGYHSAEDVPTFKDACKYMNAHGGYWQPWEKD